MFYPIVPGAIVYKEERSRSVIETINISDQKRRSSRVRTYYKRLKGGFKFLGIHRFLEQRASVYR